MRSLKKVQPRERVRAIIRSHLPLREDDEEFESVRLKVERNEPLSKKEEALLVRLAVKAEKWENEVKSSAETDPENTLAG